MESAKILTPSSNRLSSILLKQYFAFRQNPIFLKDQNMKKYQHYIDLRGEVLPTPCGSKSML